MRRRVVSLCPSIDAVSCKPGKDWSSGWLMFANHDGDEPPQIDAGEPLLQVHTVGENTRITANRRGFTLRATQKRATNGTIVVCDEARRIPAKALVVSYTGRPRVATRDDARRALQPVRIRLSCSQGLNNDRLSGRSGRSSAACVAPHRARSILAA